jgi:hypothetical protein
MLVVSGGGGTGADVISAEEEVLVVIEDYHIYTSVPGCYTSKSPLATPVGITASVHNISNNSGCWRSCWCYSWRLLQQMEANSIFSTITSAGGGGGVLMVVAPSPNNGGLLEDQVEVHLWRELPGTGPGGTGNTPPVSPPQGNNGGTGVRK